MNRSLYFLSFLLLSASSLVAQVYTETDDALQRGWWNRPWLRYEAEPDYCTTNAEFLPATDDQRLVQSEASHQQALVLNRKGDYVEWNLAGAANAITIRFSLPDSEDGKGTKGNFLLSYTDQASSANSFSMPFTLDSYWAWQYTAQGGNYPDNTPGEGKMIRMRFDETHFLTSADMQKNGTLRITKQDENSAAYVIDFIELEQAVASTPETWGLTDYVTYNPAEVPDIADFIQQNLGKTMFIPAGRFETARRLYMNKADTRIYGAGEWFTEIYFTASSDSEATYSKRGIEGSGDNMAVCGMTLNTVNNKRYYLNNDSKQVGKGFMGGWGKNSVIKNCWVEHFECGGWIADYMGVGSENLLVENCRFRNNYADGINLCQASKQHKVRYCSFRNNGDDDMASWSTTRYSTGCEFAYCTAENNWRASSLGFFGGEKHEAHHLAIYDALECGARANADFGGKGFSSEGEIYMHDITIRHCGCKGGSRGTSGDFWGNMQGAFNVGGGSQYDVRNIHIENVDIFDTRSNAFYLRAGGGKKLINLIMKNINVSGAGQYGIYYSGATGNAEFCNINIENCASGNENNHMSSFEIDTTCGESGLQTPLSCSGSRGVFMKDGVLLIEYKGNTFTLLGNPVR